MTRWWNAVGVIVAAVGGVSVAHAEMNGANAAAAEPRVSTPRSPQPRVGIFPVNGGQERHPCR